MILHTALVDVTCRKTGHGGQQRSVRHQDVLTVFPEKVEVNGQTVVDESGIQTNVYLRGRFPCNVRVTCGELFHGLQPATTGTEVGTSLLRVNRRGACIELPGTGQIEEAGTIGVVVTYLTPRSAQFQVADIFLNRFPKLLARRNPTHRERGECTVALAFGKVLRTVITDIEVYQVAGIIVIGHTSHESYVALRNRLIQAAVGIPWVIGLALVVEKQRAHIVLTELAGVVEACLSIPVTAAPLALAVRNRPGDVLLAEHLLAVDDGGNVCHARTKSVLAVLLCCIFGIVRALYLEVKTRSQETHVELVLKVKVQHVGAFVHISQVVIV